MDSDNRQNHKNPPSLSGEKNYDVWKNEVQMWVLVTDLPKRKQALAQALPLTGKYRETAMEVPKDEKNADDGMSKLIAELDKSFE